MKSRIYIGLLTVAGILTGCYDYEAGLREIEPVNVSLAFSVSSNSTIGNQTRMTDAAVQNDGSFRGLQDVQIIPFNTSAKITKTDNPSIRQYYGGVGSPHEKSDPNRACFYYYNHYAFSPGVASVLFYGRGAFSIDGVEDKSSYYGSTTAEIPEDCAPKDIRFTPTQIRPTTDSDERASALAAYLTYIAKTPGWAATTDPKLHGLYQNYIGKLENTVAYKVFGGSSANILRYIMELYDEVGKYELDATLATAICTRIETGATVSEGKVTALTNYDYTDDETDNPVSLTGYPANIGLPDGAAAMQWIANEEKFVPVTTTTTISSIISVTRYAYPAELYYYANSGLYLKNEDVAESVYQNNSDWADVLAAYDANNNVVTHSTKAAAICEPIQYGVARLSTILMAAPETLTDGDGDDFVYGTDWNDTSFPLTAVIVGGQYPVGFDFRPETVTAKADVSDTDMRYVYDCQVKTNKSGSSYDYYYLSPSDASGYTNTLVLQSYEKDNVSIVLEFENNSGKRFMGKDGIVYPGAKFYLVGTVDPETETGPAECKDRVFTQDYVTTMQMSVVRNSLKNAYNVMPDLLSPFMEIGVLLVPKWDVITPTNAELY